MKIIKLKNIDDWEEFKREASAGNELIIFKYSPVCGVSYYAENIFKDWVDELNDSSRLKISKVNVITTKKLSRQIGAELNVVHE